MNMLGLVPGGIVNFILFVLVFMPMLAYIFRDKKLNLIDLGFLSLIFSSFFVPLFAWLLNFIIPFSLLLVLIVFALPFVISLFLLLTKRVGLEAHHITFSRASIAVLLLFIISFWLRLQSLSSYFYEFDPYWYGFTPEYLVTQGEVPLYDDWAYPLSPIGHRTLPVPQYLTAVWYIISIGAANYSHLINAIIMNVYPPLMGALLVFIAYFLFKDEYSNWIAVAAAFVVAFMPVLFSKFFAGVAEQLPWGIYAAFAGIMFIHYALKYKESRLFYVLAVLAVAGGLMGSKAGMMAIVVGSVYIAVRVAFDFINGQRERVYYELPALLAITCAVLNALYAAYNGVQVGFGALFSSEVFILLLTAMFSFFVYHLLDYGKSSLDTLRKRVYALCGLGLIAVIFLITPLGAPVLKYGTGLAGVGQLSSELSESSALMKTVAEETLHGDDIQNRFGYAGISLDIHKVSSLFITKYGALNALPLVYVLLVLSLIYGFFYRKSGLILLLSIFIFSISFIGLQKIKYTPHLGLVLALAVALVAGEASLAKEEKGIPKYISYYGAGMMFLIIAAYAAFSYGWGILSHFLGGGGIPFFVPSDSLYYIIFTVVLGALLYVASICLHEGSADKGQSSSSLLNDGREVLERFSILTKETRWPALFSISAVMLVLPFAMNNIEAIPTSLNYVTVDMTNHTQVIDFCNEVSGSGARYAAGFYCNLIPDYWYDSMEWIRANVDNDSYVISWWDYGHWTNYFGRKKTMTRNDHPFVSLDLEVADAFVASTPQELKAYMDLHNSTYALFDMDLIGKWGALTYLSCVYNNETSAAELPAESKCSASYQFEYVYVPSKPTINQMCMVGEQYGKMGFSSFSKLYCILEAQQGAVVIDQESGKQVGAVPVWMGRQVFEDGREYSKYLMVYTEDVLADAPGRGYNSVFYRAFFLGHLDGFEQVYPAGKAGPGILPIRIYKKIG